MTAICKTIAVHGNHLGALMHYGEDADKTELKDNDLKNLFSYGVNESKTAYVNPLTNEKSLLVTGVHCTPSRAVEDFTLLKNKYESTVGNTKIGLNNGKSPVVAIHFIQSFKETNISPIVAHQIGVDMLKKKGYMGVVDTHMNKTHVHNHIIINAYNPDGVSKIHLKKDFILSMRKLSDDIQLEYGIPVDFDSPREQLNKSKDSLHYGEWAAQRKGTSWKTDLYQSMNICHSLSNDRTEYINLMNSFGYEVSKEKPNGDILWYNYSKSRKILESTLQKNFNEGVQRQNTHLNNYIEYANLRYSWDGRELTSLENTINSTYNTIASVINHLKKHKQERVLELHNFEYKLDQQKWSKDMKEYFGINSTDELHEKLNYVGTELSIAKSKLRELDNINEFYSKLENKIQYFKNIEGTIPEEYKSSNFDLKIPEVTMSDMAKANADLSPLSGSQRTELYLLMLSHPEFRLTNNSPYFNLISSKDFYEIKNYFKYGGEIPDALSKTDDYNFNLAYERQHQYLQKKFNYKPYKNQLDSALLLLKNAGYVISTLSKLSLADVMNIQNCLGEPPALVPDDGPAATEANLINLKKICTKINYSPAIPYSDLSDKQCRQLYVWACSRGQVPFCIRILKNDINMEEQFKESIKDLDEDIRSILMSYRDSYIEISKLGLKEIDFENYIEQSNEIKNDLFSLRLKKENLSLDYKNLIHLKQNLIFSNDPKYIFGSYEIEKDYFKNKNIENNFELQEKISKFNERNEKEKNINFEI